MAQAPRKFALDFDRRAVWANANFESSYSFGEFVNGDTERLQIYLCEKGAAAGTLTPLSTTGLTLKVALVTLGAPTSTVHTSTTMTAAGQYWVGDLPLNVAGVQELFASSVGPFNVVLEFELTDGGYGQTIKVPVTISQQGISTTLVDTPAPDTAIGNQEATARFVPLVDTVAKPWQQIVHDMDGSGRQYLMYISGGAIRVDPIGT